MEGETDKGERETNIKLRKVAVGRGHIAAAQVWEVTTKRGECRVTMSTIVTTLPGDVQKGKCGGTCTEDTTYPEAALMACKVSEPVHATKKREWKIPSRWRYLTNTLLIQLKGKLL